MSFDALILNSGEWLLSRERPAAPWHLLVYTQRGSPANELHVWLPRRDSGNRSRLAVKRFWQEGSIRWCVEIPAAPNHLRTPGDRAWIRFSAPGGRVLWAQSPGGRGLGDLSDRELAQLRRAGRPDTFAPSQRSPSDPS